MTGKKAKGKGAPPGAPIRARQLTVDEFRGQYGEGYNKLEDFLWEWDLRRDEAEPFDDEMLRFHVDRVAKAIRGYMEHEFSTLDEAFGVRRPDDYRRPAALKRHKNMSPLQAAGLKLRLRGAVPDAAFFELLGSLFKVGSTQAKKWYYLKHKGVKPDPSKDPSDLPDWIRRALTWKKR